MDDLIVYVLLAVMAVANLIIYRHYQHTDLSFFYLSTVTLIFFILLSKVMHWHTRISTEGIFYRFFPFHRKEKLIRWEDIESIEILNIRPFRDYMGYGIRYNLDSKAYIIRGDKAMKIYWKTHKKPWVLGITETGKIKEALHEFAPKINVKDSLLKKN
jgi:hypothetical protein